MLHEVHKQELSVVDSDIVFDDIYNKPYVPQKYMEDIKKANLLLIPTEDTRRYNAPLFPESTLEFLEYIKENANETVHADIAVSDESFNKLELHSATVYIATFIVSSVIFPVAINLLSNFLYDVAKKHHRKNDELAAEVNIIVQDGKQSKQISYKGPVSGIELTLKSTIPNLFENGDI